MVDPDEDFLMIYSNNDLYNYGLNTSNICPVWINKAIGLEILEYLNKKPTVVFSSDSMNKLRWIKYKELLLNWIK